MPSVPSRSTLLLSLVPSALIMLICCYLGSSLAPGEKPRDTQPSASRGAQEIQQTAGAKPEAKRLQ